MLRPVYEQASDITVQGRTDVGQVWVLSDRYMLRALNPDPLRLTSRGELGLARIV
jgi:hypothetical protein